MRASFLAQKKKLATKAEAKSYFGQLK